MSVIAAEAEPHGVTRIFFDCRPVDPDPREIVRIARTIEQSEAAASAHLQSTRRAA
jgi:hypothetical protein